MVQFAASNAKDFADAAELVAPFADGVDLNCGCPQRYTRDPSVELYIHKEASFMLQKMAYVLLSHTHRWAMAEGYGAHLIKHPELIADMVTQASSRSGLPVSIKIRIHNDLRSVGVVKKT